jgi:putative ABC transport system permease protein
MIQNQIKLPGGVAFKVVLQGIKIRFGRSVVTVTGVVLGIAFLMAILSGQALKKGVGEEDRVRLEVNRMFNFLTAEMGPPEDRTVGAVIVGPLNTYEVRLLERLGKERLGKLNAHDTSGGVLPPAIPGLVLETVPIEKVGLEASAVLVLGDGAFPSADWSSVLSGARQKVVALGRKYSDAPRDGGATMVDLGREMKADEIAKMASEEKKARFRNNWILVISLLVTVMGITNAMLMSVTERIREIGTMKCLGALSGFIRLLFLIESGLVGTVGSVLGCIVGFLFSFVAYGITYGFGLTFISTQAQVGTLLLHFVAALAAGLVLSIIAAIYPAHYAARMVPADALRSNV